MTRKHDTRRELDRAHHLLTRWAEWRIRLEGNEMGRSRDTVEARLARDGAIPSGKPPGSVVPTHIYCSEIVSQLDTAIRRMPMCFYSAIVHAYLLPGHAGDRADMWTESEGGSVADYYRHLRDAKIWVLAKIDDIT